MSVIDSLENSLVGIRNGLVSIEAEKDIAKKEILIKYLLERFLPLVCNNLENNIKVLEKVRTLIETIKL